MLDDTSPRSSAGEESLLRLLDVAASANPNACALEFFGARTSYEALARRVERLASTLEVAGIRSGDRVGICMPNCPSAVAAFFAILRLGAIVVNFNPLYAERELRHQVVDSGSSAILTVDLATIYPRVAAAARAEAVAVLAIRFEAELPILKSIAFRIGKRRSIARVPRHERLRLAPDARPRQRRRQSEIAVLQYTGGTTGVPKGVALSHANLLANTEQIVGHMSGLKQGAERVLGILPLFHIFALTTVMLVGIRLGATIVLLPRYERRDVIAAIRRTRPTLMPAVPTLLSALLSELKLGTVDLRSLKACISGGAPLPVELGSEFSRVSQSPVVEGYGMSEASPVVACNPPDGVIKPGSVGLPLGNTEISIRDRDDPTRDAPPGALGEICVRGPQVMSGYWQRAEETGSVMIDGWLRTGDIGRLDEDGYLYVVDRIKDIILCSGFNVYPRMIEEALCRHPAVAEAVAVGVPDPYRGEAPKAYVVRRAETMVTDAELKAFLAGEISKLSLPREIEFCETLPKTMVGKVDRKALKVG